MATRGIDLLAVVVGASLYGMITVGGAFFRARGLSLYEISLMIVMGVAIVLAPVVLGFRRLRPRRSDFASLALFGLVGAALQLSQFLGIVLGVPVATVALLLYSQPIWTVILGRALLREKVSRRKLVAIALALAGVAVLIQPGGLGFGADLGDRAAAIGLVAALFGGFLLSCWVVLGRRARLRGLPAITTACGYCAFSSLWLLLALPAAKLLTSEPILTRLDFGMYLSNAPAVGAFVLVAGIGPAVITMWGMRRVEAMVAGVLLLFEPISAALLAALLLGQSLTGRVGLGGLLILASNFVILRRPRGRDSAA